MPLQTTVRADARALAICLAVGAAIGLVLGGAYLAGGLARAADAEAGRAPPVRTAPPAASPPLRGPLRPDAPIVALTGAPVAVLAVAPVAAVDLPVRLASNMIRERDCLAAAVYYEARGETAEGQAAIAQVVLNRTRHPAYPKSVCGVVFQGAHTGSGCQFSFACSGALHRPKEAAAWLRSEQVAARALSGFVMPLVGEATSFHAARAASGRGSRLTRVAQVGGNVFYRTGGRLAVASVMVPAALAIDDAVKPTEVASAD